MEAGFREKAREKAEQLKRFASKPTSTAPISPVPQPQARESDTFAMSDSPASPSATSLVSTPTRAISEPNSSKNDGDGILTKLFKVRAYEASKEATESAKWILKLIEFLCFSKAPHELIRTNPKLYKRWSDLGFSADADAKEREQNHQQLAPGASEVYTDGQAMKSCTTTAAHVAGSCARSLLGAEQTPTDSKLGFKIAEQFKKMGAGLGETLNDCAKAGELLADPKPSEFRQNITTIGKVTEKFADRLAKCLTKSPKKTTREGENKESAESKQYAEQLQQQANQEGERKWQTEQAVVNGDRSVNEKHNVNEKVEENKEDAEEIESLFHLIGGGPILEHIEKIAENLKNITQKFEQAATDPKTQAEAIETAQNLIKNLTAASFAFVTDPKNKAKIEEVAKRFAEIAKTLEPSVTNITGHVITQASREMEKSFWWTRIFLNTTLLSIAAFFVITTYGRWLNLPPRTLLQAT